MPAKATGSAYLDKGRWRAKVTANGKRPSFALPTCTTREQADRRAKVLADIATRLQDAGLEAYTKNVIADAAKVRETELRAVLTDVKRLIAKPPSPKQPQPKGMTVKDVGQLWTSGELHKRYPDHVRNKTSVSDDIYRLDRHVYPVIGDIPIADFTLADAERVLAKMPPDRSAATRRQVAQLMSRILAMAVYPLRIRQSSPIPRGFLPRATSAKALAWLYPAEESTLLACSKSPDGCKDVPLNRRILYGFLAREGARWSEAANLQWSDLDLERGVIRLDENKTSDPRAWVLGADVAAALRVWRKHFRSNDKPTGRVFGVENSRERRDGFNARFFRENLIAAGVTRSELFERSKTRLPIRVHDLRGTFVTIALATGRTETWVADRTGHRSSAMINKYRRAARTAAELSIPWLANMHTTIPELAEFPDPGQGQKSDTFNTERKQESSAEASAGSEATSQAEHEMALNCSRGPTETRTRDRRIKRALTDTSTCSEPHDSSVFENVNSDVKPLNKPLADASRTLRCSVPDSHRSRLIRELASAIGELAQAGDLEGARLVTETMRQLLDGGPDGAVIDLASRRRRR